MTDNEARNAFIRRYTNGTGSEGLNSRGRFAIPCDCGEDDCRGWQMGHPEEVERFLAELSEVPADTAALITEARRTLVRPDGADLIYAEELLMRDLTDALESQARELERLRMALKEKEQA